MPEAHLKPRASTRALAGAVVAIAVLAAGAIPALAANGALVYVTSKQTELPSREQAAKKANCPDGTSVTGGGLTVIGGNTATGIASSYPFDDGDANAKPDDGWRGVANSRSAGDKAMRTYAVCSKRGSYRYVTSGPYGLFNNTGAEYPTPCDPGEAVTGGGLRLSGTSTVFTATATFPLDGTTNDVWRAGARNASGQDQTLVVHAICAQSGVYQYPYLTLVEPSGPQQGISAPCPAGTNVVGGGLSGTEAASSKPIDGRDADVVPNDGWRGAANNETGANANVTAFAVCRG